jgi:hypothetical protein
MSVISSDIDIELEFVETGGGVFHRNSDNTDYQCPVTITNTNNDNTYIIVKLTFSTNISDNNHYFTVGSHNIIFDGQNSSINVSVANYYGLLRNNNDEYLDITIKNLQINAVSPGSLANGAGWFCSNFTISPGEAAACTAINCSSTGDITASSMENAKGGIFGSECICCQAYNCYSTGYITNGSGGIFGAKCISCYAINCYSTGNIYNGSGGIFGYATNYNGINNTSSAYICFSTGLIDCENSESGSGGIFGCKSNLSASGTSYVDAIYCYSKGEIGGSDSYNNGGIFGEKCNLFSTNSICFANFCSSYGTIYGDTGGSNGGIYGNNAQNCRAYNCFSIGKIGQGSGGIFIDALSSITEFCYSHGAIGENAGGIFSNATNSVANYCYSIGDIYENAGGIFGPNADTCNANHCYNTGSVGTDAGGIYGTYSSSSNATNCYVLGNSIFGSGANNEVMTNCMIETDPWSDSSADSTINDTPGIWFSPSPNTPYLLLNYNAFTMIPEGYKYTYILPVTTTFTTSQTVIFTIITGFYRTEQNDSVTISNNIFGYTFNYPLVLQIEGGTGIPAHIPLLFKQIKKINL